ncbi:FRG domain-containing protein [Ligilactobacillus sp. WILCCON 0076]|uniref:FRG domain-containing protein n=1 Tax=Ligilactobacillus ubinensis TaxID=2876789 RepID=A0A9X2FL28_9LACO|nr:FRG domain-containing protein [Ligilactobacillus ubinensis]MCP0887345.1 FRG domain-containing protein [Ligilactobacillus ubinensis]
MSEYQDVNIENVYFNKKSANFNDDPEKFSMHIDSVGSYITAIMQSGIEIENNELFNRSQEQRIGHIGFQPNPLKKNPYSIFAPTGVHEKMRRKIGSYLFYRGESQKYDYTRPSIFKEKDGAFLMKKEKEIFQKMISVSPELQNEKYSTFDKLAIMQHHGVPTRLLDISSNPLDALYFAVCQDEGDGSVQIFKPYPNSDSNKNRINYPDGDKVAILSALSQLSFNEQVQVSKDCQELVSKNKEILKPEDLNNGLSKGSINLYHAISKNSGNFEKRIEVKDLMNPLIVVPNKIDSRISAQNAAFLLMGLVEIDYNSPQKNILDLINAKLKEYRVGYLTSTKNSSTKNSLIKISIKQEYKKYIRTELELLGINIGTIYTDMNNKISAIEDQFYSK